MSKPSSGVSSRQGSSHRSSPSSSRSTNASDGDTQSRFKLVNATQEAEDRVNIALLRESIVTKPSGTVSTIANIVKCALGSGILSGHVAYMKAGAVVSVPLNIALGIYLTYSVYTLASNAQILYKRTGIVAMSYPDIGECAMTLFPNPKVKKWAKTFRYCIDAAICIELFGACTTYQLIIAKTIKQLVEDKQRTSVEAQIEGYPDLRLYNAIILVPIILMGLLRYLQWLAPFAIIGNLLVVFCIIVTVYYVTENNPYIENLVAVTDFGGTFEFIGTIVFSMSCASQIMSIENNMKNPKKLPFALTIGMIMVVACVVFTSFFGYAAYLDKCDAPITVNFPMTVFPKILKGAIAVMLYLTHALNFWIPFSLVWYYLKKRHNPNKLVRWELFYRALIITIICIAGMIFPDITGIMGFLGCFCLSNAAFIWPNVIELLVRWPRPGLGKLHWRLWKSIILMLIGTFLWIAGTIVSVDVLVKTFSKL